MVCYNQVYILIRDYKKFMNTGFSSFPLGTIRKYVWDEIQEKFEMTVFLMKKTIVL